jgi:tripartite motif-containing protein 71
MLIRFLLKSFVFGFFGMTLAFAGEPPFPDDLQYPNIVPPKYQFGTWGAGPSEMNEPSGVAISTDNTVFISDRLNHRVLVVTLDGKWIRDIGVYGQESGRLSQPSGLALTPRNEIIVADSGNNRIQIFNKDGVSVRMWGSYGTGAGEFNNPEGVSYFAGKVYVADTENHRIQVFTETGKYIREFGGFGKVSGKFNAPLDLALDDQGNIYVADSHNNRIQKFASDGSFLKTWGQWGSFSGFLATASSIAYNGGRLFVTDLTNHRIQVFDTDGNFQYQWGRHPPKSHEGRGRIHYPTRIAISPNGKYKVVCEGFENRCQVFSDESLSQVAQVNDSAWWDKATRFHYGARVSSSRGNLAISEPDTHSVLVFDNKSDVPRLITRFGGQGTNLGSMVMPSGIALKEDLVIASDSGNHRLQMFKLQRNPDNAAALVENAGAFVKAYDFKTQSFLESASDKRLVEPSALRIHPDGKLFMLDPPNSRVLVFDENMNLVNSWGTYGTKDGQLRRPLDLSFSKDGKTVFIVDAYNYRIQAFNTDGKFLFKWGESGPEEGKFVLPFGITSGHDGFVYVTDEGSHRVQKFSEDGKFLKQWGRWGAANGEFYKPKGITQDEHNRIIVVDFGNHRCQIFDTDGQYVSTFGLGRPITDAQEQHQH